MLFAYKFINNFSSWLADLNARSNLLIPLQENNILKTRTYYVSIFRNMNIKVVFLRIPFRNTRKTLDYSIFIEMMALTI